MEQLEPGYHLDTSQARPLTAITESTVYSPAEGYSPPPSPPPRAEANNHVCAVYEDEILLREVLPKLAIQEATALFGASTVLFFAHDEGAQHLFRFELDAMFQAGLRDTPTCTICPPWGIVGEALASREPRLIKDVNEYRRQGQEVFFPEVDCPTKTAEVKGLLSCPILALRAGADGGDPEPTCIGAISLVLEPEAAASRSFGLGDQRVLELLCNHLASLVCAGQYKPGIQVFCPERHERQGLIDAANPVAAQYMDELLTIGSKEDLFAKMQQVIMQQGIRHTTQQLVGEHVEKAWKLTKEWRVKDLLDWFEGSQDAAYPEPPGKAPGK